MGPRPVEGHVTILRNGPSDQASYKSARITRVVPAPAQNSICEVSDLIFFDEF